MTVYREDLPQLKEEAFLTDSGLEADLIFNAGIDLPEFASFPQVETDTGRAALHKYYVDHVAAAVEAGLGLVLEAATWRASTDWGARLGYDAAALRRVNESAVALLTELRSTVSIPVVVSGAIGPQADAYRPSRFLTLGEARMYHAPQVETLAATDVDMVHAMTITYVQEAVGIASTAKDVGLPVAVSFTVETDGLLPDGTAFADAIRATDASEPTHPR